MVWVAPGITLQELNAAAPKKQPPKTAAGKTPRQVADVPVETTIIDVIEEPVPGVVTVTEFEETQIPGRGWVETKGDHKS
jgi:hypothetical protein